MNAGHRFALPQIAGDAPTIVHLAAEYYPYARTGGLAEAAWGLHRDQHRHGLKTMAIVPLYRTALQHIGRLEAAGEPFTIQLGPRAETFRLWREMQPASETPTCFLEHDGFFNRDGLYGEHGSDYPDNYRRFAAFAAASVVALPRITDGPVLLHAHDWHAALAAVYARTWFQGNPWYDRIPIVLSVHNGGYQGHFAADIMPEIGLPWSLFTPEKLEWYGKTNYLKGGLTHTDMATTVSPTHAEELRTPAGGFGLQEVFESMGSRFTGVLNGIDQSVWDPATDPRIAAQFSADNLDGKRACKLDLQRRFGLPENPFVPVVASIGRMATQKGLDIVVHNQALFHFAAQYVFMGSGDKRLEQAVHALHAAMPNRVGVVTKFSDATEHVMIAGADLYLMPSQYEPCGLTQMRAQRYGTIPLARRVGGLADTIDDGLTGFLFDAFDERALAGGMWRALTEHRSAKAWREMQREAMGRDFGWGRVAERYNEIYARAIALAGQARRVTLRFVLTLHSHLPWVLHHGRWPHGSDWICEAALDSYLPLVAMLDTLEQEDVPPPLTIGITPILAAQFAHPSFREELDIYFAHRLKTIDEAPESLRQTGDAHLIPLVVFWKDHVLALKATWDRIGKDLIAAFRRHALAGRIELISSAATHGFLPLLGRDESIRFQLLVGRAEHARHFGDLPRGCWVPECAYRPTGPWQPLPNAPRRPIRVGVEDHLRFAGFQFFFADAHIVEAGEMYDLYTGRMQRRPEQPVKRSPYQGYRVGNATRGRPIYVLVRDPATTAKVWSRHEGYPGDGAYLEFHKIRHPGGLKLWKVTDSTADLGAKLPYVPRDASDTASRHAAHFQSLLDSLSAGAKRGDESIVAPFDTELFGHWWFEGMDFLRYLYEDLSTVTQVKPVTASDALTAAPPEVSLRMGTGSWGKDGDFSMWLNPETEWTWERLWPLEDRFWNAVPAATTRWDARPIIEQAGRELLLAQSSDWQFIITTGAAGDYAIKRFNEHCAALDSLLPFIENPDSDLAHGLAVADALKVIDGPFPDLMGAISAASDVGNHAHG